MTATVATTELTILEKIKALRGALIFSRCKTEQLLKLASIAQPVRFEKGSEIFRENDSGDSLYHIVEGSVRLRKPGTRFDTLVSDGETFGTLAFLDRGPHSAIAIAEEDVLALRVGSEDFYDLLADNMEIVQGLFACLVNEIRQHRYVRVR